MIEQIDDMRTSLRWLARKTPLLSLIGLVTFVAALSELSASGRLRLESWTPTELVFIALLLLLIPASLYRRRQKKLRAEALKNHGREATAVITDVQARRDSDGNDAYWLTYTFTTPEQGPDVEFHGKYSTDKDFHVALQVGQQTIVRYLPEDPKVSEVLGRETTATVTDVDTQFDDDGREIHWLEYSFTTPERGPDIEFRGQFLADDGFDLAMQIGTEIRIRYLPTDPDTSYVLS